MDGTFIGRPKRKSNIMQFAGSLAHLDDDKSWKEIREETERIAAQELASSYEKLTQNRAAKLHRIKIQ